MTAAAPPADPPRAGVAHQMAARAAFFLAGFAMSAWAPLIPFAKARLNISDGHLGVLLLCLGTGSVIGMPAAGGLAGRFGCRKIITISALLACGMLPVLAAAPNVATVAVALLLFGAAVGTLDVVMNVQAVIVEARSGRSMMSGFHGLYSVGSIAGASCVSALLSLHATPVAAAVAVTLLSVATLAAAFPWLLPEGGGSGGPAFAVPRGLVLALGLFCFVMFLAEGSVLDWSAVLLTTLRGVDESHGGVGYVAFAVAMTACRLTGDRIVAKLGARRVVIFGGLIAAGGFVLAAAVPSAIASIIGFALVGLGASNVVPVMFTAAGRQTAMPTNLAIAAITTLGYAGILLGPAAIGFISAVVGLPVALCFVAGLLLCVAAASVRVTW